MDRTQFTFYESFFKAVKRIKDPEARAQAYDAICAYALYGNEPEIDDLPDCAAIAFELIKPNLDSSRKKAENGKAGGKSKKSQSKKEANQKQKEPNHNQSLTEKEKEGENKKEKEKEKEDECPPYSPPPPPREASADQVVADYLNRVNPMASPASLDELRGYVQDMGPDCCRRAIDIALDEKSPRWSYVRGILRAKLAQGVRCLADWDRLDAKREEEKKNGNGSSPAPGVDQDGSFHGFRAKSALDD